MVYLVPNAKDRQDVIAYLKTLSKYCYAEASLDGRTVTAR